MNGVMIISTPYITNSTPFVTTQATRFLWSCALLLYEPQHLTSSGVHLVMESSRFGDSTWALTDQTSFTSHSLYQIPSNLSSTFSTPFPEYWIVSPHSKTFPSVLFILTQKPHAERPFNLFARFFHLTLGLQVSMQGQCMHRTM